jgi:hypothetical protein
MFGFRRITVVAGAAVCALAACAALQAQAAPQQAQTPAKWRIIRAFEGRNYLIADMTAPGRSDAWAFGAGPGGKTLALHWNGKTWAASFPFSVLPLPASAVASSSPDNVWVAGGCNPYEVNRWNGHRWTTTTLSKLKLRFCLSTAVTTGPDNGWLFTDSELSTTAAHFNGRTWQPVTLGNFGRVVAASAVSATNIWLLTFTTSAKTLLVHFDGKTWRKAAVPAPSLPKGDVLVPQALTTAGARSVWATVQIWTSQDMMPSSPPDSLLLHWNGQAWKWIPLPGSTQARPAIAPDGASGAWVIGATDTKDVTIPAWYFLHWTGRVWTGQRAPVNGIPGTGVATIDVLSLAHVPGTRSVLASGLVDYNLPSGTVGTPVIYGYIRP